MLQTNLTPQEVPDGIRGLGLVITTDRRNLIIEGGHLPEFDDRRRQLITHLKPAIIELILAEPHGHVIAEREAIQFADTAANPFLQYAISTFGACEVTIFGTPETIAQHEEGLISEGELDAWLSKCNHDPHKGSWHLKDNHVNCRYCGGFHDVIISREIRSRVNQLEPGEADTPTFF